MKIYILKTLCDIHNNYGGIDDVRVSAYTDLKKAQDHMKEFFNTTKNYFIEDEHFPEQNLDMHYEDYLCYINNNVDYYSAEIVEDYLEVE